MADDRTDERLAKLEQRLSELEDGAKEEKGGKDFWDKFQVLASLLIPAAVAFSGYYFSDAMAKAQLQSEEHRAQADQAVAEAGTRVSQAELIATFMKSLLSDDRAEKELAIQAVILALPEEGPQLVAAIQWSSADPETAKTAKAALTQRREKLVQDLHASDEAASRRAAEALTMGFRKDPELVKQITAEVEKNPENREGVARAVEVLQTVPQEQLTGNADAVARLERVAERHDDKPKALFKQLKLRVASFPIPPLPSGTAAPTAERRE